MFLLFRHLYHQQTTTKPPKKAIAIFLREARLYILRRMADRWFYIPRFGIGGFFWDPVSAQAVGNCLTGPSAKTAQKTQCRSVLLAYQLFMSKWKIQCFKRRPLPPSIRVPLRIRDSYILEQARSKSGHGRHAGRFHAWTVMVDLNGCRFVCRNVSDCVSAKSSIISHLFGRDADDGSAQRKGGGTREGGHLMHDWDWHTSITLQSGAVYLSQG